MKFPDAVERWRPIVRQELPDDAVDKALWTIMYESGGDPDAVGDDGAAIGLFQIHSSDSIPGRPSASWLSNPVNNIRYAARELGAATGDWSAWGENNLYNGQIFGALGIHPFPGDNPGSFWPDVGIPGVDLPDIDIPDLTPWSGALPDVNPIDNVTEGLAAIAKPFQTIANIAEWLFKPQNWFKAFFVASGGTLIIIGLYVYVRGSDGVKSDIKTASTVAAGV